MSTKHEPPPVQPDPANRLGRERRFRITKRLSDELVEIVCNRCAQLMNVKLIPENYYFTCICCRENGNLPGVLAAEVDRWHDDPLESPHLMRDDKLKERSRRLAAIRQKFPTPVAIVVPPPQTHRQST